MSKETKPKKPRSSTKKSTSELEAKIAELEAKLGQLSSQVRPAEVRSTPPPARPSESRQAPPAPKPRPTASGPTHGTLPAGMAPPKPKEEPKPSTSSSASTGEVAPAYAQISSTGYTGNKYFATRARLSYHPPDKQYKGESVTTTQASTSRPSPQPEPQYTYQESASSQQKQKSSTWKAKGAQVAEEYVPETSYRSETRPSETRPAPPPAPKPRPTASGPTHGTLPAGMAPPPKPKEAPKPSTSSSASTGEVAPAYAQISSTGYTGNKYFATRARLSYHPPDKQYKGAAAQTVKVAPEPPKPKRGTMPSGWKP